MSNMLNHRHALAKLRAELEGERREIMQMMWKVQVSCPKV